MSKICIFLYKEIRIKSNFKKISNEENSIFILTASKLCLENISEENKSVFDEIIEIDKFEFHDIEEKLKKYLDQNPNILTNEESCAIICAQIREKYNLSGSYVKDILPFVDKVFMKKKLDSSRIRRPRYENFNYIEYNKNPENYLKYIQNKIGYPMIAKPTTGFGSINTMKIFSYSELQNYVLKNLRNLIKFEVDEYIEGDLYHCDGLIKDNKIVILISCRYNTPCINFSFGNPLGSLILEKDDPLKPALEEFSKNVVNTIQVPNGAFHLELFLNKNQELIFLEIAARTPGALVIPAYEKMFGFNFEEQHYRLQLRLSHVINLDHQEKYAAWMIFPMCNGIVSGFKKPSIKSKYNIKYLVMINQKLSHSKDLSGVAATLILSNNSYQDLMHDFIELESFNPIEYIDLT